VAAGEVAGRLGDGGASACGGVSSQATTTTARTASHTPIRRRTPAGRAPLGSVVEIVSTTVSASTDRLARCA
jgi:hypothetical protein